MKTVRLTKQQARLLRMQIEGKESGYTIGDLRKVDKFLAAMDKLTADYDEKIDAISNAEEVEALDDNLGSEEISFSVEDAWFDCVKSAWKSVKNWMGNKKARALILAIDDSLGNAEESDK